MESWAVWKEQDGEPIGPRGEVAGTLPGTSSSWCQHQTRSCGAPGINKTDL